jgi:hypothetical protein
LIQFPFVRQFIYLVGEIEQPVGLSGHRGDHDDHLVAFVASGSDPTRDTRYPIRVAY